jgi:hypothetical protein
MTQPPVVTPNSGFPSPPAGPPPGTPPRRGWFGRNWKWFVPLVIVLPIIVCCGGITTIMGVAFGAIKSSEPYKYAVAQAEANPQVVAALGTPIKTGFMVSGNINLNNDAGNADLSIPVSGPKGSGTIHVVGTKTGGVWTYNSVTFQAAGSPQPIDLIGGK